MLKFMGVPVKVTAFQGNLFAVTMAAGNPCAKRLAEQLTGNCGGADPLTVLSEDELTRLPEGLNLVFTSDSYQEYVRPLLETDKKAARHG